MVKKCIYYITIIIIVTFITFGFKPFETENHDWFLVNENEQMLYHFPSQNQSDYKSLNIPFTGKFFIGYKEAIGFKESQGKYNTVNTLGCLGKYQFALPTLKTIGINDSLLFLRSPRLQEKAFVALLSRNKWELKDEIDKYCGKVIGGIKITESGILAAAHLGGVGSVKKYFKSGGKRSIRDGYGTSLQSFMKKFGGYETSGIIADANARVK